VQSLSASLGGFIEPFCFGDRYHPSSFFALETAMRLLFFSSE